MSRNGAGWVGLASCDVILLSLVESGFGFDLRRAELASFGGIGFVRRAKRVFEAETGINGFVWKYGVAGRGGFDLRRRF